MFAAFAKVAILGGDPVIGGSLETLLRAAGYRARFLREPGGEEIYDLLANFHILLVAPELSAEYRGALREMMVGQATPSKISVLELLPADEKRSVRGGRVVPWPCSMEELERAIDAALLDQE